MVCAHTKGVHTAGRWPGTPPPSPQRVAKLCTPPHKHRILMCLGATSKSNRGPALVIHKEKLGPRNVHPIDCNPNAYSHTCTIIQSSRAVPPSPSSGHYLDPSCPRNRMKSSAIYNTTPSRCGAKRNMLLRNNCHSSPEEMWSPGANCRSLPDYENIGKCM